MAAMVTNPSGPSEVDILARVLGNDQGRLSPSIARHLLNLEFSADDKVRMHDLAERNQRDALSPAEREELLAYAKTGTLISILKSRARQVLRTKAKKPIRA